MLQDFHYQLPWRSHSAHPGHHPSTQAGGGFEFYGHTPLMANPDPRHLDIHAGLHDPYGQFVVRTFRQHSAIPVFVIADISASMGFQAIRRKINLLAEFSASVAYSAFRTGDRFGFIGCDEQIEWDLFLPLRWHKGQGVEHMEKLRRFTPKGNGVLGLIDAAQYLGKKRALLFLVSDFHFPIGTISSILDAYPSHDVVPVVVWDTTEFQDLPNWAIARLRDPETRREKCLFMRPKLHAKFKTAFERRRNELIQLFLQYGREPFFIINEFDADDLTRYFSYG